MHAIIREVPASFANALAAEAPREPIDVARARAQHGAYSAALASLGCDVTVLAAAEALPDCCFVEDTAVVVAGVAVVTHPGAPSRRAEVEATAAALAALGVECERMEPPATLDGGDCMRVGRTIFVGRSARTNAAGIAFLSQVFEPRGLRVVPVDLPRGVLHLKCACAPLGDDWITLARPLAPEQFPGPRVIEIPDDEAYAANVLAVGNRVLMAAGFPRTAHALAAAGLQVMSLETSEFRKADGALTCLSILV